MEVGDGREDEASAVGGESEDEPAAVGGGSEERSSAAAAVDGCRREEKNRSGRLFLVATSREIHALVSFL